MSLGQIRNFQQLVVALNGFENRHGARLKYRCSDEVLSQHPEWLLDYFVESGGARAFAKLHGSATEFSEPEYCI